jgi:thiamine biosynthesis lipoprotein ApbE
MSRTASPGGASPAPASPGPASSGPAEPAAADWRALGTQVWLLVTDPGQLAEARRRLEADLDAVDRACSRFRPDSELMRLGTDGPGPASTGPAGTVEAGAVEVSTMEASTGPASTVEVSPLLAEAIAVALRAARVTDGDVDPTVADAMSDLGYDRDFSLLPPVGPPVRLTVRAVPGWRQVGLDEQARLLTLPRGVHLDLGATAKAWAADRAASRLAGALGCGALVGLGGDISVAGPPPPGGWRIRVQDITGRPEDPPEGPAAVVAIGEGGLATSSTTARRWRRGGDVLHHILDPRTGLPASVYWRTVSVAAASCVDANTASTAAIIRGPQALDWLSNLGLPARLVDTAGNVRTVGGWPAETR